MREPLIRAIAASRCLPWRYSTMCRALASSVTWKRSPASGTPCRPSTSTGVEGGASLTTRPRSSNIARTLPNTDPQMKKSPEFSVPFCTRIVATGPRPLSTRDSSTVPVAGASGLALSSRKSATNKIVSSNFSMPCFFFAETSTNSVSPPHSAGIRLASVSCLFTRSSCASGLSILFIAMINVAHNRPHGRTRLQTFLGLFLGNFQHHLLFQGDDADHPAEGFGKGGGRRNVQRLVDAGEDAPVEQVLQQVLGAHIQLFGQFANGDAFRDGHLARRTRLGRRDNRDSRAAACARTLPGGVQFAFTLLLALIRHGTLALGRLAGVKRLTRLRLRRHFLWKGRQHSRTPGRARARTSAGRHRAATLLKRPGLWSSRTSGAARSRREWPSLAAGLLWTYRLPGTRAARARTRRRIGQGSAIASRQRTAISCRQWPSRTAWSPRSAATSGCGGRRTHGRRRCSGRGGPSCCCSGSCCWRPRGRCGTNGTGGCGAVVAAGAAGLGGGGAPTGTRARGLAGPWWTPRGGARPRGF